MNIEIHGPGRAGGSLAIAAERSGHRIVGIEGRTSRSVDELAMLVDVVDGAPDLRLIAVSDDAIADVAFGLVDSRTVPTVHVSGAVPVDALSALARTGTPVGAFHPLQTLPDPATGAERLPGSWIAITAAEPFDEFLQEFARSLDCTPFDMADDDRALYHAAAASVANYSLVAMGVAERLFSAAGVPFDAARPLVDAIVANAFSLGPAAALTGPVARGDVATVARQIEAVRAVGGTEADVFTHLTRAAAAYVDSPPEMIETIG